MFICQPALSCIISYGYSVWIVKRRDAFFRLRPFGHVAFLWARLPFLSPHSRTRALSVQACSSRRGSSDAERRSFGRADTADTDRTAAAAAVVVRHSMRIHRRIRRRRRSSIAPRCEECARLRSGGFGRFVELEATAFTGWTTTTVGDDDVQGDGPLLLLHRRRRRIGRLSRSWKGWSARGDARATVSVSARDDAVDEGSARLIRRRRRKRRLRRSCARG